MFGKKCYLINNKWTLIIIFFFGFLLLGSLKNKTLIYAFNPHDYEIDYSQKHQALEWKHEDGHVFSDNARVFYNIPGIKMVPCKSYQEFANIKQLGKDGATTVLGFIPGWGIFDAGFDYSGIYDRYVNCTDEQIAILNDMVYYYLSEEPGKGFFFFDLDELSHIQKIDISFCDCEMASADTFGLLKMLFPDEKYQDVEGNSLEEDNKTVAYKKMRKELKQQLIKKINQKVGHTIARKSWKKTAKKTVGKTLGRFFVPGIFNIIDKAEKMQEAKNDIKKRVVVDIQNNNYEKTIGFIIHFVSEDNLKVYEIKKNNENQQISYLSTDNIDISGSTHMLINLIQTKNNGSPVNINIYGGQLRR